jgi:hypothetical protein
MSSKTVWRGTGFKALNKYLDTFVKPIPILNETIKKKQWLSGIVMASAFFELLGSELLKQKFKDKIAREKLEDLRLEHIILLLFSSKLVNQTTYTKMMEVKEVRNHVVHNPYELQKLKEKDAKKLIQRL